jgi:PIN domain nuclease of toxin-antitoxin system
VTVVDASALLAFLQGESGADLVEQSLEAGAVCGAANWSEVAQKVQQAGRRWDLSAALLASYNLEVESVTRSDAETAALLWTPETGLSLGDRLCLALGVRTQTAVMTADQRWGARVTVGRLAVDVRQIR